MPQTLAQVRNRWHDPKDGFVDPGPLELGLEGNRDYGVVAAARRRCADAAGAFEGDDDQLLVVVVPDALGC